MEREDDVQALKREVELLKSLLIQEREKSNGVSQRELSPTRPASPTRSPNAKSPLSLLSGSSVKEEQSPRTLTAANATSSTAGQRGMSMRWNAASLAGQPPSQLAVEAQERSLYLQHVPVDTKRGKWWLKDRQVLSRNAPSPYNDCIAIKVRETWVWSGRTVVVDKIVTCPRPANERNNTAVGTHTGGSDDEDGETERATHVQTEGDVVFTCMNEARKSQEVQPADSPSKSKLLAQEFKLPPTSSAATTDQMNGASERMEHQMVIAAKEANQ